MRVKVIDANPDSLLVFFKKIWAYRSLIVTLAKRDLKIKYAQTYLGATWAVLQPLVGLVIFTFFFDKVIKIDVPGGDYTLFALSGMTSWYFFSYILSQAGSSLVQGQDLMKKIFFPKLVLPLSKVLVGLVDFMLSLALLLVVILIKGTHIDFKILLLPFFVVINIITGLSVGLFISAVSIKYRDLQHVIPYLTSFGIWLTPVFYPVGLLPVNVGYLMKLNPMVGVIEGFRYCLLPNYSLDLGYLIGIGISIVLFILALLFFKSAEDNVVDSV